MGTAAKLQRSQPKWAIGKNASNLLKVLTNFGKYVIYLFSTYLPLLARSCFTSLKSFVWQNKIKSLVGLVTIVTAFTLYYGDFLLGLRMLFMTILMIPGQLVKPVINMLPSFPKR